MVRGGINHLAVTVSNLAESEARFYAPVLGYLGYQKVENIPGEMTLWFNGGAGLAINIWQAKTALKTREHQRYAPGFHHCAFSVENREAVDVLHGLLIDRAIRVLDAPAEYPHYAEGYYAVFFADEDALKYEAVHMPALPE
jgi:catechol 2,3-dioxygenase-like lactoylglutathione lyase family enzyme